MTDRGAGADAIGRLGPRGVPPARATLAVPTFAFVNGAALGGGLELALHCTYRTHLRRRAGDRAARVFLGLVPGWGGTYLLPNLIGADKAVTVIVENPLNQNRMLTATQAFELGIADAMFEPADFLEQSLLWAAEVLTGDDHGRARRSSTAATAWDAAVARGTRHRRRARCTARRRRRTGRWS